MKIDTAPLTDDIIDLAIREDVGDGDHTSLACIPPDAAGKMQLLVKQAGIAAGVEVARRIFQKLDSSTVMEQLIADGAPIKPGDVIFYVTGNAISLLQAERLVLNFMQRLSGIATQTAAYAAALDGLKTKVIDTRKTTPGMRVLEKMAVALGGGSNHRMGLYDMILIKDNHVDFSGGIEQAIKNVQAYLKKTGRALPVEVEVRSLVDVKKVLALGGVDRIMLDNFSLPDTRTAVELIGGRYEVESSGGITLATLRQYAECGVDYISAGALTHQIKSLDLSLKAVDVEGTALLPHFGEFLGVPANKA
ncbi:MAG: carboxylating nicotinate-nucleotide diphosphorylase [Prevotellaceae bacterium]|jgi:nicotinate-nucleotide pyrophosphorylase (carboxylating)|nr:carboxylating nicotinate-nucleotide diphosphorylase [Prevotellaceae bacterium]